MKLLSVAYPLFPVSADSPGGAEQVLFLVERGLVASGCKSLVVAARGSRVTGQLVATPITSEEITGAVHDQARRAHLAAIQHALEHFAPDLIHFHGLDFHAYLPKSSVPKLATLHLPLAWYDQSIFQHTDIRLCCVSHSQARTAPDGLRFPIVPNGIDIARFRIDGARHDYLLWLGRICPEKGTDIALRVARRLDLPLIVAGPVHLFASHQAYFSEKVAPLLDDKRRWIGPVGQDRKSELLSQARCVLIPSLAPETGSLVGMEAIASGTPVVAFRSGALPEIVSHGATGFIVDTEQEMAHAVSLTDQISSARCREEARLRFDVKRMVEDYLNLYRDLLASMPVGTS